MTTKTIYTSSHHILFSKWIAKERKAYKANKRRYLHFDPFININGRVSFFKDYFSKPKNVCRHSFYPLLRSKIKTPRVKWTINNEGKKVREWLPEKERQIFYASHFDSFIYSWYSTVLNEKYESKLVNMSLDSAVIAYRSINKKCNIHFAKEAIDFIKNKGECVTIALDFSSFFDNLDHEILKNSWCEVLNESKLPYDHYKIFKNVTKFTYVENDHNLSRYFPFINHKNDHPRNKRITTPQEFRYLRSVGMVKRNPFHNTIKNSDRYNKECGIPQGLPISAVLSNIYLLDFDFTLNNYIKNKNGFYRRYSDDIFITCDTKDYIDVLNYCEILAEKFELNINNKKTDITQFRYDKNKLEAFFLASNKKKKMQYLGFEFNGLDVFLRSSSVGKYNRKLKAGVRETIKAAFGKNGKRDTVFTKKLFLRYTRYGKNNFISYSKRSVGIFESDSIRKQIARDVKKLKKTIRIKAHNRKLSFQKRNKKIKPRRFFLGS